MKTINRLSVKTSFLFITDNNRYMLFKLLRCLSNYQHFYDIMPGDNHATGPNFLFRVHYEWKSRILLLSLWSFFRLNFRWEIFLFEQHLSSASCLLRTILDYKQSLIAFSFLAHQSTVLGKNFTLVEIIGPILSLTYWKWFN